MALTAQSLLCDLDARLPQTSESWRSTALRQIADLFVSGAESYDGEQTALFDEVMGRLIKKTDRAQLAELSGVLAGIDNGPTKVLASLARHVDPAVFGPVIERAKALPDDDLVEIADKDRIDPNVLAKIAARGELSEPITDILLKRGNAAVRRKVIGNPKARISEMGFARVVSAINGDKALAAAIAARPEMPAELRPFVDAALNP
ncbi:MAG: DUF2336 domain-containing protein [Xanthobacteraceae bacterium]